MSLTSKLTVYNDALRELGAHPLSALTEDSTRLRELENAFPHAVEYVLGRVDWNHARERITLNGVADLSVPDYQYRFTLPADWLRTCWFKENPGDEFQLQFYGDRTTIYAYAATGLMEYISDGPDTYDPVNWGPHFVRAMTLYLALLVGPKLSRAGSEEETARRWSLLDQTFEEAEKHEALFLINEQIPLNRQSTFRIALELMGQEYAGSVPLLNHADRLRYYMNRNWDHALRYTLEQGAWNYASRRTTLSGGDEVMPGDDGVSGGVVQGYSLDPVTSATTDAPTADRQGFQYGFTLPSDFVHKIVVKADANYCYETPYQIMGDMIFADANPLVLEYVAEDAHSTDPDNWTSTFREAIAAKLALHALPSFLLDYAGNNPKIKVDDVRQRLETAHMRKIADARTKDAIQQYPAAIPPGRFVQARRGYGGFGGRYGRSGSHR